MAKISKLPKETYDRIAAGEVVTSPAAVVKELVENSLDSGASAVTVEIQEGGRDLIRVSDNGCGMGKEDLALSIEKHATSKIEDFDDLYALSSLGFRGEALASIAEVSRLTISSREKEADTGYTLSAEGKKSQILEAGLPEGTSIKVEDIFFNIPARRKNMRSAAKEGALVTETVKHLILSRPQIAFKYIRNGHVVYQTPGDGDLKKVAAVIFGPDILRNVLDVDYQGQAAYIRGIVSKPTYIFKTPSRIELFVNGRYVQSKELQRAVLNGYKGSVLTGHYPQAILSIDLDPASLDINVHPSKISVLLFSEEDVMHDVSAAVAQSALKEVEPPVLEVHAPPATTPDTVYADSMRQPDFWQQIPRGTSLQEIVNGQNPSGKRKKELPKKPQFPPNEHTDDIPAPASKEDDYISEPFSQELSDVEEQQKDLDPPVADIRTLGSYSVLGTAFATYVLCESGDTLYIVDQHAARERLTYERLMEQTKKGESYAQLLLLPVVRKFSEYDYALLDKYADLLKSLGVHYESFGELTFRFSGLPVRIDDIDSFLDALIEDLKNYGEEVVIAREKIIMSACRHSVKAGTELTEKEIEHLMEEITTMSAIPHCPHGRPIAVAIPRRELEKGFKRVE